MKGDFSRNTFDPRKHYSRVLMQQGRVTLDADPNEQTDILLHYLRTLAADLIGPYGGPKSGAGFHLSSDEEGKLLVGAGRYYVDGILVENDADTAYREQPFFPMPEDDPLLVEMEDPSGKLFWVYLDVWERHVTHIEDERIREKALGGPDTCSRSQVVWQVKASQVDKPGAAPQPAPSAELQRLLKERDSILEKMKATENPEELARLKEHLARIEKLIEELGPVAEVPNDPLDCHAPIQSLVRISAAQMAARVDPGEASEDPCVLSPEAKYRGTENHLYRIEIHDSGKAGVATFKWSRDNGSVAAAWLGTEGDALRVSTSRGFTAGCWVELLDDSDEFLGQPGVLVKIARVEGDLLSVDSSSVPTPDALAWSALRVNPKIRRWDQKQSGDTVLRQGAVPVSERSPASPNWLDIEDGIQVCFEADGEYRTGDYWLIPARVATGDVEWPVAEDKPEALPPRGIEHHFAPLGFLTWVDKELQLKPCTCAFPPLADCSAEGKAKDKESLGFRPAPRPLSGVAKPKPEAPGRTRSAGRPASTAKARKGRAK